MDQVSNFLCLIELESVSLFYHVCRDRESMRKTFSYEMKQSLKFYGFARGNLSRTLPIYSCESLPYSGILPFVLLEYKVRHMISL